jgi:hypothetical protein
MNAASFNVEVYVFIIYFVELSVECGENGESNWLYFRRIVPLAQEFLEMPLSPESIVRPFRRGCVFRLPFAAVVILITVTAALDIPVVAAILRVERGDCFAAFYYEGIAVPTHSLPVSIRRHRAE